MMAFQNLKASSFGDLLDNPSGWTAKGGQPGDARGIVPAHVKGSTPDSAPSNTQEERTQAGIQPSEPEDTPTGSTPEGTPEERTASAPVLSQTPAGAHTPPGTQAFAAEESAAGPMDSTPEATGPVNSMPDALTDPVESTPGDKPQDALSKVPPVSSPSEGVKEAEPADVPKSPEDKPDGTQGKAPETPPVTDSPEDIQRDSTEEAPGETDGTPAKAPEASRAIPDRSSAMERLVQQLEDRPELAETFLKMFSLMPEAPGAKKTVPPVPKPEAPAPPDKADTVEVKAPADPADSDPAGSPAVPDKVKTPPEGAAEEVVPSPETTPETSAPVDPDEKPEALPVEGTEIARPADAETPVKDVQRSSDDVSGSSKVITPAGDEKAATDESTKALDLSPVIDAAIRKSFRDIFASLPKNPAPDDATLSLPDSDDPLQILSAALEPVEQARAAKAEATKVDQLLTLEQLTRSELIAMESVLKELRTLARRQEVHLSLNRGAVKNGLTEVRQNLSDFREFLSTKSEPVEDDDEEAETPVEVSLADLAERIDYIRQALLAFKEDASRVKPAEPLPDAKALQASYDETLERMEHIPNALDEGIQKVLGNAQRQVDRYCTKFLSVHKKKDHPLLKALPFIAAFLGGFLGALVVGQALLH